MIGRSVINIEFGTKYKRVEIYYRIVSGCIENVDSIVVTDHEEKHYVLFSADLDVEGVKAGNYVVLKEFKEAAQRGLKEFKEEIGGQQ
jgi:hypothetical protein